MRRLSIALAHAALAVVATACGTSATSNLAGLSGPSALAYGTSYGDRLFVANAYEDSVQVLELDPQLNKARFSRGAALHFPLRISAGADPRGLASTPVPATPLDRTKVASGEQDPGPGSYLVVLNGSGETLRLLDADNLVPATELGADARRHPIVVPAGPSGSLPAELIGAPHVAGLPASLACEEPCLGRFYVSLAGAGVVAAFEVSHAHTPGAASTDPDPTLTLVRTYAVGGAPVSLALDPTATLLFVADTDGNTVLRVDLDSGAVLDRFDVGDQPGAVAVSNDGTVLAVARPRLSDLVFFADISSSQPSAEPLDVDPWLVPTPKCVEICGATEVRCPGAHPADQAVCSPSGIDGLTTATLPGGAPRLYTALYLQATPAQIMPLGSGTAQTITTTCIDSTAAGATVTRTETFSQGFVVSLLEGTLRYVTLRGADGLLEPALGQGGSCPLTPTMTMTPAAPGTATTPTTLADFVGECPDHPARNRAVCTPLADDPSRGFVSFPGASTGVAYDLQWEGVIIDTFTAGVVSDAGSPTNAFVPDAPETEARFAFYDDDHDLGLYGVQEGDILQILSTPSSGCKAGLDGSSSQCAREWKVLALDKNFVRKDKDGNPEVDSTTKQVKPPTTRLILARRNDGNGNEIFLSSSCFDTSAPAVSFNVRVGGGYKINWVGYNDRLHDGDVVGPGGKVLDISAASFRLKLPADIVPPDVTAAADAACSIYATDGSNLDPAKQHLYSRSGKFSVVFVNSLTPAIAGYLYLSNASGGTLPGRQPTAMALATLPLAANAAAGTAPTLALFVTYASSNALFGYLPLNAGADALRTVGNSVLFR
jgi:DNA-binding beta-propeller fold protein YncE